MSAFESLNNAFGIEGPVIEMELIEGVDYIPYPHVKVAPPNYDDLVKFAQDPENLKKRGKAISKGKKGNKVRPFSAEARANISAAVKKRWAEGNFRSKTHNKRDAKGRFTK